MTHTMHKSQTGHELAYVYTDGNKDKALLVFCGGFKSDMTGTKATFLEESAKASDIPYLRFDYSGHGASEGNFPDGTIGTWAKDAESIIEAMRGQRQVVLVGSSMGGWISLLLARQKDYLKALVLLAPAPDFTRDVKAELTPKQLKEMDEKGRVEIPNDYSDEPYIFTKALLEDGEAQCLLDEEIPYDGPVDILQGMQDADVDWSKAIFITEALKSEKVRLHLLKDAGHSLSRPEDLALLWSVVEERML
ncbi:MAG: alpha/beta hydrolase [Pseudobdellovibrionaceae bacterium]